MFSTLSCFKKKNVLIKPPFLRKIPRRSHGKFFDPFFFILGQKLKKCFKNTSLFFVLAFKILHTEKVTFLKVIKKWFFVSRLLSRGPMALKTCGKDVLENFCFFHKIKILIWWILDFFISMQQWGGFTETAR